jgi:hypothetical protein
MTQKDYEYLFVAANLAQYHPTWGFTFLVNMLKMFLGGNRFYISADGTAGSHHLPAGIYGFLAGKKNACDFLDETSHA